MLRPASFSSLAATWRNRSRTQADTASPARSAASSKARFSVLVSRSWRSSSFRFPEPARALLRLGVPCRRAWGSDVYFLTTMVPHNPSFPNAAGSVTDQEPIPRLALRDDRIRGVFAELFQEM